MRENYATVKAALIKLRNLTPGWDTAADVALAALETMRQDGERLDAVFAALDSEEWTENTVFMALCDAASRGKNRRASIDAAITGGDAPCPAETKVQPEGRSDTPAPPVCSSCLHTPHLFGCAQARAPELPTAEASVPRDEETWLREKAAAEDGCLVSVGGLVTDLEKEAANQRAEKAADLRKVLDALQQLHDATPDYRSEVAAFERASALLAEYGLLAEHGRKKVPHAD